MELKFKYGITGNYYFTSTDREDLVKICIALDKAVSSIYYNNKYRTFVIRIKSRRHKILCKKLGYNKDNYYLCIN